MANGFFLGGAAEGMESAAKQALARDTLTSDTDIRNRGLSIQDRAQTLAEKNAARTANQSVLERVDKQVSDTMAIVADTVKSALATNKDPETIRKAITPLVDSAKSLTAKAGGDPNALDARVGALFVSPTGSDTAAATVQSAAATAQGKVEGEQTGKINAAKARGDANLGPEFEKDKVSAENTLRDDYTKASSNFYTMRDAKSRLDNLDKSGAGDMALVFQFMKMLDPTSTVREGEYASAANSGGVPSSVQALYNKALGEGSIGDKARSGIMSQSLRFFEAASKQHDKIQTNYANIAKRQGINPDNVIVDPREDRAITGKTPGGIGFRATR